MPILLLCLSGVDIVLVVAVAQGRVLVLGEVDVVVHAVSHDTVIVVASQSGALKTS